jgi:hypothetical protein
MYVISISDAGEERNFLATDISFVGHHIRATINGSVKLLELAHLIDIYAVDDTGNIDWEIQGAPLISIGYQALTRID